MLNYCHGGRKRCSDANTIVAPLFDPTVSQQAYNEVPVQYLDGNHMVHGIIDRLLVSDGEVTIIDYKTHQLQPSPAWMNWPTTTAPNALLQRGRHPSLAEPHGPRRAAVYRRR